MLNPLSVARGEAGELLLKSFLGDYIA